MVISSQQRKIVIIENHIYYVHGTLIKVATMQNDNPPNKDFTVASYESKERCIDVLQNLAIQYNLGSNSFTFPEK